MSYSDQMNGMFRTSDPMGMGTAEKPEGDQQGFANVRPLDKGPFGYSGQGMPMYPQMLMPPKKPPMPPMGPGMMGGQPPMGGAPMGGPPPMGGGSPSMQQIMQMGRGGGF